MNLQMIESSERRREAAQWFVEVCQSQDPSSDMLLAWRRWMEASESNRIAFKAVEQAWHLIPDDGLQSLEGLSDDGYDPSRSVDDWLRDRTSSVKRHYFSHLAVHYRAVAAGVLFAMAVLVGYYNYHKAHAFLAVRDFSTRIGEQLELNLADGSHVTLGAKSVLSVNLGENFRDLSLKSGEAYFIVSKDPKRPFRVYTPQGLITALGTAFNVRSANGHTTVAVTDGSVKIDSGASRSSRPDTPRLAELQEGTSLSRGQQITIESRDQQSLPAVKVHAHSIDPREPARWREGWFVYHDEPLSDVIADIARYTERPINLDGGRVEELRFTGVISRGRVVEWVKALPEAFPVTVVEKDDALILSAHDQ